MAMMPLKLCHITFIKHVISCMCLPLSGRNRIGTAWVDKYKDRQICLFDQQRTKLAAGRLIVYTNYDFWIWTMLDTDSILQLLSCMQSVDCINNSQTLWDPFFISFHVNSLWPGDAIWWHETRSTLTQIMACCLTAPSHYLNQCWLIIGEVPWLSSEGIIRRCEDTNQ